MRTALRIACLPAYIGAVAVGMTGVVLVRIATPVALVVGEFVFGDGT